MTISEKLAAIAENQQKVFDSGQKSVGAVREVTGNPVRLDYAHRSEHELDVRLENKNKFDISRIESYGTHLVNNGDGTITVNTGAGSTGVGMGNADKTLGNLVPELEAGKTYTLSATTTGTSKFIYLSGANYIWNFGTAKLITEVELNSEVIFYASGLSTTATISNIQIEEGTAATPYTPHLTDFSGVKVWRYGKNLLRLDGREVVDFGAYSNTTKRTFTGNGIIVGIANNNYYNSNGCTNVEIEDGVISGTTVSYGYGVGFDVRVLPRTQYIFSCAEIVGRACVAQYNADGEYLTANVVNAGQIIATNANTAWCLISFNTNTNETFRAANPQLEMGAIITEYEDGVVPVEYVANEAGIVDGIKSLAPTTVLVAESGVRINAKYILANDYEWNTFWDSLQHNGDGTADYRSMFFYWNNDIYKPKYPIYSTKANMSSAFSNARIENTLVDVDLSKTTNCNSMFNYSGALHTIPKLIVAEQNTFVGAFAGCPKLVNITVEGTFGNSIDFSACPLSKDSILSVFNALSTTKTGQTVTFNKDAVNAAFTDDEWNDLIATKTNWSYGLV